MTKGMFSIRFAPLLLLALCAHTLTGEQATESPGALAVTIANETLHRIDARLFGQLLERAGKNEPGPEAAVIPGTGAFDREVMGLLRTMEIPVIRFPGGGSVEYGGPWTHLIDDAYDRDEPGRPEGHRFGLHAFMRLCRQIDAEPLLVTALTRPLREWHNEDWPLSVERAAAYVAYCNAPVDAELPAKYLRWARLRARNGHPEPWAVKLWQIGNEPFWAMATSLIKEGETPEAIAELYVDKVAAQVEAMRAIDPSIEILVEIQMEQNPTPIPVADRLVRRLGDKIDYFTFHMYQPWAVEEVRRGGERVDAASLSERELYNAAVAVPQIDPRTGESIIDQPSLAIARRLDYPVGMTEWNWNGWWTMDRQKRPSTTWPPHARGLGAAGFLHAFMRAGDTIKLGNQSMLVGSEWAIAAVRVPGAGEEGPTYATPTGLVTGLYSRHHGERFLRTEVSGNTFFAQPFRMNNIRPKGKVAHLDVLATRDADTIYLHAINRDPERGRLVLVTLEGFETGPELAQIYTLREKGGSGGVFLDASDIVSHNLGPLVRMDRIPVLLPARSANVVEIKLIPKPEQP